MKKPPFPPHIDKRRLPAGVYWQAKGRGRWYTSWRENGRQRTATIAGPDATLADIHAAMEARQGIQRGTLRHLVREFEASAQFAQLAEATRRDYQYSAAGLIDTKMRSGRLLGDAPLSAWTRPSCQQLVDKIARERGPSAANHALRYLKRLFRWGMNRGHLGQNVAVGVEPAVERKQRRLPSDATYSAVLSYAMECGSMTERTPGSCAPYLWPVIELAYLLRLRGVEILDLTDAHASDDGVSVARRKGSRGNITEWSPRVRAAWDALAARRGMIYARRKLPVPMHAANRHLVVAADGAPLKRDSLSSAWDRFIKAAIRHGVIDAADRFSLHDLKRRGVTKTAGGWDAKRDGSGHKSDAMREVYDQSVPVVRPVED